MLKSSIYLSGSVSCYQFASVLTLKIVYRRIFIIKSVRVFIHFADKSLTFFFLEKKEAIPR